jgi:polysaccharide pyruvyl transferase WcaK-like protein
MATSITTQPAELPEAGRGKISSQPDAFLSAPASGPIKMEKDLKSAAGQGKTILFFGHFGSPNFGNEITFQAAFSRFRQRLPQARFACVCTDPQALVASQKIEGIPISRNFGVPPRRRTALARLLRRIFIGVPQEILRWVEAFRTLRGVDLLIVPGTGLLTDAYGLRGWGPYNLFKWSLMAKVRGCKILFLSVGAGPLYGWLGRFLAKSSLAMADFRSYRDDASMNSLKECGFPTTNDRIYPDLVFGLPEALIPRDKNRKSSRRVVGLGLMVYAGKYSVAEPSDSIYQRYLETLVSFTQWLLQHNYDIRLLLGEATDTNVLEDFKALLKKKLGTCDLERLLEEPMHSFEDLLPQIAATDVVVATRFHNVLLSLLLDKPVLAISFHRKCDSLMSQMGMAKYCQDINHMSAAVLIEQFQDLEKNAEHLKPVFRQKIEQSRKALDEQFELVCGLL